MRRKLGQAVFIVLLSASSVFAVTCPKGSSEWQGGCVVDIAPEVAPPVQPSDEKPPTDKMPSYEREGANVVTAPPGVEASSDTAHDYQAESNQK
jgi:hypothetical protein